MKKIVSLIWLACAFLCGCENAENKAITDNRVFIKDAFERKEFDIFTPEAGESVVSVPVTLTRRDDTRSIEVSLSTSEEALTAYNIRYGKNYKLYPKELWRFESEKITFNKGATSAPARIIVQPISPELASTGEFYTMPIVIAGADDGVDVLEGANVAIYRVRGTPKATVAGAINSNTNRLYANLPHTATLEEQVRSAAMTIEFLIKFTARANANNFTLIQSDELARTGGDGHFFSRVENAKGGWQDAEVEFSVGGGGNAISAAPPGGIQLNKWYHVAFVFGNKQIQIYFDGQLAKSKDISRAYVSWYKGFEWIGGAFNRDISPVSRNSVMFSELRIWDVVRTPVELTDYMYAVNPQTPGLVGYWKMDDGAGNVFKDYSGKWADSQGLIFNGKASTPPTETTMSFEWYENEILTVGQ
jgi:hypothetical protein